MEFFYKGNIKEYARLKQSFITSSEELKAGLIQLGLNSEEQIFTNVCKEYINYFENIISIEAENFTEDSIKQHFKDVIKITTKIQAQAEYCKDIKQITDNASYHIKDIEKDANYVVNFSIRHIKKGMFKLCNDIIKEQESINQKQAIAI